MYDLSCSSHTFLQTFAYIESFQFACMLSGTELHGVETLTCKSQLKNVTFQYLHFYCVLPEWRNKRLFFYFIIIVVVLCICYHVMVK